MPAPSWELSEGPSALALAPVLFGVGSALASARAVCCGVVPAAADVPDAEATAAAVDALDAEAAAVGVLDAETVAIDAFGTETAAAAADVLEAGAAAVAAEAGTS